MTVWSLARYLVGRLKYWTFDFLRLWFGEIWWPLRRYILWPMYARCVLMSCYIEAGLRGIPRHAFQDSHGQISRFSRVRALRRLHGRHFILQDLYVWAQLLLSIRQENKEWEQFQAASTGRLAAFV